ncbi:MAG: glycosyltransferase family protein [Syntrophobacteraceae bacterium]
MIYSHDSYGLGHIRRCLAIAGSLRHCPANVLIITGSVLAGRFKVPDRIDFVRVPGMIKKTNEEYLPLSMKLDAGEVLNIRRRIILATAAGFLPDFFIVDKAPLGMKREVLDTLLWLRSQLPSCRTVLGLRDIMDGAESTIDDWTEKGVYNAMQDLYDEIWVYGCRDFYDSVKEYRIPGDIALKTYFTGYIHRKVPSREKISAARDSLGLKGGKKTILVTTGGGGDGYPAIDAFLCAFDRQQGGVPSGIGAVVVTGPFIASHEYQTISRKCSELGFTCLRFSRNMERLIGTADAVVSMGGYNTVCEIISQQKPLLILPRTFPREEQLIRARVLSEKGYCEYLNQGELTPAALRERILNLLGNSQLYSEKMSTFPLTGLDLIKERIKAGKKNSRWEKMAAILE